MATKHSQLSGLTYDELLDIGNIAPSRIRLTPDAIKGQDLPTDCTTVKDVYRYINHLKENGETDTYLELRIKVRTLEVAEVEKLARDLMEKILSLSGGEEDKVRNSLVSVLDYQTLIRTELKKDKSTLDSTVKTGSGYFLFSGMTDEEINHFWNG